MKIIPYLVFDGRCDEALDFYRQALGAKVDQLMRFREAPEQPPPDQMPSDSGDKVMHAAMTVGETQVFLSDGMSYAGKPQFSGISLALNVASEAEAERAFAALAVGGTVTMPLTKTFFSPRFGMVADRFGITWMVAAA